MNLRNMASQIALSIRPPTDVAELDTLVDRLLVLNWAQTQVSNSGAANFDTLQKIHETILETRLLSEHQPRNHATSSGPGGGRLR